ncbi:MAG: thrombospondin type 3 repeat-containing protein [Planctomycetes bacterium]|nr:thrombospondin type 3 repeat-containing protein [Planctomycetota bacterium]MBI3834561.1 thrombospondin type 3 repeat-containing protein [Planctomycetota bacterium]
MRSCCSKLLAIAALTFPTSARADELAHGYEFDALPEDTGFLVFQPCDSPCSEAIENGHLVNRWSGCCQFVNYFRAMYDPPESTPPPPFWLEWRFRTNDRYVNFGFGGGGIAIYHRYTFEVIYLYADAAVSQSGNSELLGLALGEFRTYRFEKPDESHFCYYIDGRLFYCLQNQETDEGASFQILGDAGRHPIPSLPGVNEWDYVRFGQITTGEAIVASDPPAGSVESAQHPNLDSFTVTFDQPNYVHVDEVSVQVSSGVAPQVIKTRRQDNGPPETVEIVLDRPLQLGVTTTFTFATGGSPNTVTYTLVQTGACCQSNGTCIDSTDADCASTQGTFTAGGQCSTPSACCLGGGSCQNMAGVCCSSAGGTPNPSGVCEGDADRDGLDGMCGDLCPNDPDNDIDGDGICGDVDPCPTLNPNDANHNGIPDCQEPTPIPTMNQWGLTILTLALLAMAKAYAMRRA